MKLFKSKAFIGVLCLVLAALVSFLLIPRFFAQQKATALIPRANREIEAGTTITADMLSQTETGSYGLSDHILRDAESIVGMVAGETIHNGEFFWKTALLSADDYALIDEAQNKGLEKGLCLVTIKCPSASAGVAGVLRSGSRVDVFSCMEKPEEMEEAEDTDAADAEMPVEAEKKPGEEAGYVTTKVFDNLYVYDVLNSNFESLDKLDEAVQNAVEGENTNYNFDPTYVVIRCTEEQAGTLICLERSQSLHLTLQRMEG